MEALLFIFIGIVWLAIAFIQYVSNRDRRKAREHREANPPFWKGMPENKDSGFYVKSGPSRMSKE